MNPERLRAMWPATRHERWMAEECEAGLVSVVVPTFDRAGLLVEALDSVRAQTYRPIELLIVDDGSTDGTGGVVEEWRAAHAGDDGLTVRFFRQENAGAPSARNLGLVESRGEYVQFLDSDDLLHPAKLATQVQAIAADERLDFVYSGTVEFRRMVEWDLPPRCGRPLDGADRLLDFLRGRGWNTISGLYRRCACESVGPWDEALPIFQDWDYGVRLLLGDPAFVHVAGTLSAQRRQGEDRVTAARAGERSLRARYVQRLQWLLWIRQAGRLDREIENVLAEQLYEVASLAVLNGHVDLARDVFDALRGLKLRPQLGREAKVYSSLARLPAGLAARSARAYLRARDLKNRSSEAPSRRD